MCTNRYFFSNSVHLGLRTGLPDKILKRYHQRIILAKIGSKWPSSFREGKIKMSSPFSILATLAMLMESLDCRTQFWKRIIQGLFKQIVVSIDPVISEDFFNFTPPPAFFIFSNSGHVGWRSGLPDTILEGDHPRTIPPKVDLKRPSGFRGEYS